MTTQRTNTDGIDKVPCNILGLEMTRLLSRRGSNRSICYLGLILIALIMCSKSMRTLFTPINTDSSTTKNADLFKTSRHLEFE